MSVRIVLTVALVAAAAMPVAAAKGPHRSNDRQHLYRDCAADGRVDGHYSLGVLRAGLADMPDDLASYSACPAAIRIQIVRAGGARSPILVDVDRIYRECGREGVLHPGHRLGALRLALRTMPTDLAEYSPCSALVTQAIKQQAHARSPSGIKLVYRECGHHGRLRRSYPLATLRRALTRLPDDLASYSKCPQAIRSAIERAQSS